ncbi:SIMPL domain-containing protein [Ruminococcus flavefaciens]|uniref:SIMPL domain-containing protein n=1 Tax=Ruminococcus flavefaciens TaxID=1265 RepID=UPI0002E7DC5A|nr:SIMPL domain-containing protein [Ruminococcus flavefaciens]
MASIIVRGTGSISVKPDLIDLGLDVQTRSKDCGEAMEKAEAALTELRTVLEGLGFERDSLKTSNFNVYTEYESVSDENGMFRNVFKGYCCSHSMSLQFPMNTELLASVLRDISSSSATPQLSVRFSVKDTEAVRDELIRLSAADAKHKALVLCEASGAKLGKLLKISYDRTEKSFESQACYDLDMNCMRASTKAVNISPDDISLTDCSEFEWEMI